MWNHRRIKLATIFLIIVAFLATTTVSLFSIGRLAEEKAEYAARVLSLNIRDVINQNLQGPIVLSQMMANDEFLIEWLQKNTKYSIESEGVITPYLRKLNRAFESDTIFLISTASGAYYNDMGMYKIVSKDDSSDSWYYKFMNSEADSGLSVDMDASKNHRFTVFANAKILDKDGAVIGACGMGVSLKSIQKILEEFETQYNVKISLIDKGGVIRVDTNSGNMEGTADISILKICFKNPGGYSYTETNGGGYIVTRFMDGLDWFMVLKKDSNVIGSAFNEIAVGNIAVLSAILILLLICTVHIMKKERTRIERYARTDELTQVLNRKFITPKREANISKDYKALALFDIDHFKQVNDVKGHLYGDRVLVEIAKKSKGYLRKKGNVIRWGGDEFLLLFRTDAESAVSVCEKMRAEINATMDVTISVGVVAIECEATLGECLLKADSVLYRAKIEGRNRVVFIEEDMKSGKNA